MVKDSSYLGTHTICFSLFRVEENRKENHLFF